MTNIDDSTQTPPGYWLGVIESRLHERMRDALGDLGLRRGSWRTLHTLADGPATADELAQRLPHGDERRTRRPGPGGDPRGRYGRGFHPGWRGQEPRDEQAYAESGGHPHNHPHEHPTGGERGPETEHGHGHDHDHDHEHDQHHGFEHEQHHGFEHAFEHGYVRGFDRGFAVGAARAGHAFGYGPFAGGPFPGAHAYGPFPGGHGYGPFGAGRPGHPFAGPADHRDFGRDHGRDHRRDHRRGHRINRTLADFVERGWVWFDGDRATLTDEGRAAHDRAFERVRSVRSELASGIAEADYATTLATLEAMARNLGWQPAADEGSPIGEPNMDA